MKTVVAIAICAAIAAVVLWGLVKLAQKGLAVAAARRAGKQPWTVEDRDLPDGSTQVVLAHPVDPDKPIGEAIPCTLPQWEFTEILTERRIEAVAKAADLNRKLPA